MKNRNPGKSNSKAIDEGFAEIRRTAIAALFSDDVLLQKLVVKGGNALELIHGIGGRSSMDLDLSIEGGDFENLTDIRRRLSAALQRTFRDAGLIVFDERFSQKPTVLNPAQPANWGGYVLEFKLIEKEKHEQLVGNIDDLRRNAALIWTQQQRVLRIEISRHEYFMKQRAVVNDLNVYVYTLPMIAVEKLRAICQQMPVYTPRRHPSPRARDFYDIFTISKHPGIDLLNAEVVALVDPCFRAKDVPVELLERIGESYSFHEPDWPAVVSSTPKLSPSDYRFYFEAVSELARRLYAARVK